MQKEKKVVYKTTTKKKKENKNVECTQFPNLRA